MDGLAGGPRVDGGRCCIRKILNAAETASTLFENGPQSVRIPVEVLKLRAVKDPANVAYWSKPSLLHRIELANDQRMLLNFRLNELPRFRQAEEPFMAISRWFQRQAVMPNGAPAPSNRAACVGPIVGQRKNDASARH